MNSSNQDNDAMKSYRRSRRLVRIGQALMAAGCLVILSHWIAHIVIEGGPPGIQDLLIGYPTGFAVIVIGAIMAGQSQTKKR
ncbi:hypothetical protein [Arthrobacter castelli]|uniref:hypothetical protein n=1 Tax=Arthrobacter castelli TaxID=271431 RepID=UPI000424C9E9|nr:hypothetical protein [Arthrobacter castelli]